MAGPAHLEKYVVGSRPRRIFDWQPVAAIQEARNDFNRGVAFLVTGGDDDFFYLYRIPRRGPPQPNWSFFAQTWPHVDTDTEKQLERRSLRRQEGTL